jgi:hypothetical protein
MTTSRYALSVGLILSLCVSSPTWSEEGNGIRPLRSTLEEALRTLPVGTHVLLDGAEIERYLSALDDVPPDWKLVYGGGHHDPGHDERLFALNRERDGKRSTREALAWPLAFLWEGQLSAFDVVEQGFRVALGPKIVKTGWGFVRFKYDDLPARLVALAGPATQALKERITRGGPVEVDVLLFGRLIPEESVIYEFSHDEEGAGLIMPVVRIESVDYALKDSPEAVR